VRKYLLFFAGCLCVLPIAIAGAEQNIQEIISDAQYKAAARFQVPSELLNAIKQVESKGHPWALCVNLGNGKSIPIYPATYYEAVQYLSLLSTDNIDVGPWQVNYHYIGKRLGVTKIQMLNPYVSSLLAAYKLSSEIAASGYTWHAVGNYHSYNLLRKIKYVTSVKKQLAKDGFRVGE
jgi:hypothetical protein